MTTESEPELIKMSELSRRSGVSAPTIKHYIREGLLPEPYKRTSRNMAWYDAGLVSRIQRIKQLQREQFLPLRLIKDVLDDAAPAPSLSTMVQAISQVLTGEASDIAKTRRELIADGVAKTDMETLQAAGLLTPDSDDRVSGDDLTLLGVLGDARGGGLDVEVLPSSVVGLYVDLVRQLVETEVALFQKRVLPVAHEEPERVVAAAANISERLILVLRRKLLRPALEQAIAGTAPTSPPDASKP